MLAKLWKKILLAICIIAILFNITSKLVRRYSLDEQLNSVVGSGSLSDVWNKDSKKDEGNSKQNNNSKNLTNKNNGSDEDEYYDDEDEYSDDEYDNNSNKKNSDNKNSDEKKSDDKNSDEKKSNNSNKNNNSDDDDDELNVDFGEFDMDEYVNQTQKTYRDLINDLY